MADQKTANVTARSITAETLGNFMDRTAVNYEDWLIPLKKAMVEFEINTPARIAAFWAQIKIESGGMSNTTESIRYSNISRAQGLFPSAFPTLADATSFYNSLREAGQPVNWYTGTWTQTQKEKFANRIYSSDHGIGGQLGNGNEASGDGWFFRGRGLKQLTGRGNTQAFADYLDKPGNHIAGQPSGAQIMADPSIIATNLELAARSAAWFWAKRAVVHRVQVNLNTLADELSFTGATTELADFNSVSSGVGAAGHPERWTAYTKIVNAVKAGTNPYENMQKVLESLGVKVTNKEGYEKQFGISLRPPTRLPIDAVHLLETNSASNLEQSMQPTDTYALQPAMQTLL
jgi:putative chitinase